MPPSLSRLRTHRHLLHPEPQAHLACPQTSLPSVPLTIICLDIQPQKESKERREGGMEGGRKERRKERKREKEREKERNPLASFGSGLCILWAPMGAPCPAPQNPLPSSASGIFPKHRPELPPQRPRWTFLPASSQPCFPKHPDHRGKRPLLCHSGGWGWCVGGAPCALQLFCISGQNTSPLTPHQMGHIKFI